MTQSEVRPKWVGMAGPILLWFGLLLFGLALMDAIHSLPWTMPRLWYVMRPAYLLAALLSLLAGARLVWRTTHRLEIDEEDDDSDED